jgi:hypothetical protein
MENLLDQPRLIGKRAFLMTWRGFFLRYAPDANRIVPYAETMA